MTVFPPRGVGYANASATGKVTFLATYYLREKITSATYACDDAGNIYQK
jgi:hypothetical protein